MKSRSETRAFLISCLLALIAFFAVLTPQQISADSSAPQIVGPGVEVSTPTPDYTDAKVQVYYFYSNTCSHCLAILQDVIYPMQAEHPGMIDVRLLELGDPVYYQALMKAEAFYQVRPEERSLPTTLIKDQILIGEEQNRAQLANLINEGLAGDPIPFPVIDGLDPTVLLSVAPDPSVSIELCSPSDPEACEVDDPIHVAYFYQVGCKDCNRVESDLNYLQSIYPNMLIEEFNVYEDAALANWMAERSGRLNDFKVPAIFIGDKAWIGEGEITPQALESEIVKLETTGSEAFWLDYDPNQGTSALIDRFASMGWVAILLAGLVDGLNPCAFATIVFFISYLTLSGRKGKEIILTGVCFTVGVFLTYLLVGLGFYQVLDLIKDSLAVAGRIVYLITALLCLVLAYLNIRDYVLVRRGGTDDMALKLPEPLRKKINETVREGRKASNYYLGAFITGMLISILELACTGQIYLPVIIFMSSQPELRGQAISYLVLYNLMFIVPLVVVFVLAYYGTSSKDLSKFLKDHAAAVKLGMAVVFLVLAVWLLTTLF